MRRNEDGVLVCLPVKYGRWTFSSGLQCQGLILAIGLGVCERCRCPVAATYIWFLGAVGGEVRKVVVCLLAVQYRTRLLFMHRVGMNEGCVCLPDMCALLGYGVGACGCLSCNALTRSRCTYCTYLWLFCVGATKNENKFGSCFAPAQQKLPTHQRFDYDCVVILPPPARSRWGAEEVVPVASMALGPRNRILRRRS